MSEMWRKSSYSADSGNCVEFRKSSYSDADLTCVEVCTCSDVQVRDSKDTAGPVLAFGAVDWQQFVGWLRG
jgi:hypothetical protein